MAKQEVINIIEDWFYEKGLQPPAEDAKPALDWAYERGIMQDGAYERPASRTDVVVGIKKLYDLLKDTI